MAESIHAVIQERSAAEEPSLGTAGAHSFFAAALS
jgi:hypothetical protein